MTRVLDLPNVEAAVNIGLQDAGLRAYSSLPNAPTFPAIVSMRLGGAPAEKHALDAPRIQIEVWGHEKTTSKSELLNYARDAWRETLELEGETVELSDGEAVFISSVNPEIGLQWLPDPPTGRPRYIASFRVYAKQSDRVS